MFLAFSIDFCFLYRYVALCKSHVYDKVYIWRNTFIYIGLIWFFSVLMNLPVHLGWGGTAFDEKAMTCLYDRTKDFSFTLFFALVGVSFPLVIVIISYAKIFLFVHKTRRQMAATAFSGKDAVNRRAREELKLAKTLFIICLVFFVFWGAHTFTIVLDFYDTWPKWWHAISLQLAHSTSSGVNFILYGITNDRFRVAYQQILSCGKKVTSTSGRTTSMVNTTNSVAPDNKPHTSALTVTEGSPNT